MMDKANLERLHARILHTVMDSDIFEDEASLLSFPFDGGSLKAATIQVADESGVSVVFGLPTRTSMIFLTVTDGDVEKIANVITHLEDMMISGKSLNNRHLVRFDSAYLRSKCVEGLIILPVSVSPALRHVPKELRFEEVELTFHLLVFLSEAEYAFWKCNGNDQLMEKFDLEEKDLICINQCVQQAQGAIHCTGCP